MSDRDLPSHTGRPIPGDCHLPTFMVGCQAQPRVGTHTLNNLKTKILT